MCVYIYLFGTYRLDFEREKFISIINNNLHFWCLVDRTRMLATLTETSQRCQESHSIVSHGTHPLGPLRRVPRSGSHRLKFYFRRQRKVRRTTGKVVSETRWVVVYTGSRTLRILGTLGRRRETSRRRGLARDGDLLELREPEQYPVRTELLVS